MILICVTILILVLGGSLLGVFMWLSEHLGSAWLSFGIAAATAFLLSICFCVEKRPLQWRIGDTPAFCPDSLVAATFGKRSHTHPLSLTVMLLTSHWLCSNNGVSPQHLALLFECWSVSEQYMCFVCFCEPNRRGTLISSCSYWTFRAAVHRSRDSCHWLCAEQVDWSSLNAHYASCQYNNECDVVESNSAPPCRNFFFAFSCWLPVHWSFCTSICSPIAILVNWELSHYH